MRLTCLFCIFLVSVLLFEYTNADKKNKRDWDDDHSSNKNIKQKHEYKKYNREYSGEIGEQKSGSDMKSKWSPQESSEEIEIIQYRKKKGDKQKKTLGDVIEEKKQKKEAKKEKFKKNVLKYFNDGDEDVEEESSEEIIAPLRRKLDIKVECDSSEEEC